MKLEPLTLEQCQQVRIWRNNEMECWRTPFMLTEEMQEQFYHSLSDRNSDKRYWAIIERGTINNVGFSDPFLGMGGINNIQWENRIGEITLIINPKYRSAGVGEKAVDLLLDQAFNYLNLQTVCGECYVCNSACKFWKDITDKYSPDRCMSFIMPHRKYWKGEYSDSLYFSIDKDDFNKVHNSNKQSG